MTAIERLRELQAEALTKQADANGSGWAHIYDGEQRGLAKAIVVLEAERVAPEPVDLATLPVGTWLYIPMLDVEERTWEIWEVEFSQHDSKGTWVVYNGGEHSFEAGEPFYASDCDARKARAASLLKEADQLLGEVEG